MQMASVVVMRCWCHMALRGSTPTSYACIPSVLLVRNLCDPRCAAAPDLICKGDLSKLPDLGHPQRFVIRWVSGYAIPAHVTSCMRSCRASRACSSGQGLRILIGCTPCPSVQTCPQSYRHAAMKHLCSLHVKLCELQVRATA